LEAEIPHHNFIHKVILFKSTYWSSPKILSHPHLGCGF